MKKRRLLRAVLLSVLAVTMLFSFTACKDEVAEETEAQTNETASDTVDGALLNIVAGGESEYVIIRPDECEEYVRDSANGIRKYIKEKTGVSVLVKTASSASPAECEILVGETDRAESKEAYDRLRLNDSKAFVSGKKIVVAARTEDGYKNASNQVKRAMDVSEDGSALTIKKLNYSKNGVYSITSLNAGSASIWEYGIVISDGEQRGVAEEINALIAKTSGVVIKIYESENLLPDGIKPFYIGSTVKVSESADTVYQFGAVNNGIALYYTDAAGKARAFIDFQELFSGENTGTVDMLSSITPSQKSDGGDNGIAADIKLMSFNVRNGWNTSNIGNRDDLAAQKILSEKPDVVGLQEFDYFYRNATGTAFSALVESKYAEVGASEGSWNPIFYNKETVTPVTYGFEVYDVGVEYDNYPNGGSTKFRTITWALFEHKASGKQFFVFNTHLDVMGGSEAAQQHEQVTELNAKVDSLRSIFTDATAIFVMGDLNSTADSATGKAFFDFGFKDTHELAAIKDDSKTTAGDVGKPVSGTYRDAIDHIYCIGETVTVSEYKTILDIRDASDHCPIAVSLTIGN